MPLFLESPKSGQMKERGAHPLLFGHGRREREGSRPVSCALKNPKGALRVGTPTTYLKDQMASPHLAL